MNKIAFVGSFDYFHTGHWYVVSQVLGQYDVIYIIIANNPSKHSHSLALRKKHLQDFLKSCDFKGSQIYIKTTSGLTTEMLKKIKVNHLLRGYRNDEDKSYEDELYQTYLLTMPNLKRTLIKSDIKHQAIASSKLK